MRQNLATKLLGSLTVLGALSTPINSQAGDYVQEQRWGLLGAGHTTTYIHTEPKIVFKTRPIRYLDGCGCYRTGIQSVPEVKEVITNRCTTSHVHWDQSLLAIPEKVMHGIGRALTPRPGCNPCPTYQLPKPCCEPSYSTSQEQIIETPVQPETGSMLAPVPQIQEPAFAPKQPTLAPPRNLE